jgi:phosphomevalonate kinase
VRVAAPGKLLLVGAYAVLEGAPAIVLAVDRYVFAGDDVESAGELPREVREALKDAGVAIERAGSLGVDAKALFSAGRKLGLGSSAAAAVAALGWLAASRGENLEDAGLRRGIFERARAAHARVQAGGSGLDVAASTFGGVLRYRIGTPAIVEPVRLPAGLVVDAYFSGRSARTSDMRARIDAFKARDSRTYAARMAELQSAAVAASSSVERADARAFVRAVQASEEGLTALGRDADAAIVVPEARPAMEAARGEGAAFVPSGAGGGDVFVRIGTSLASLRFDAVARAAGLEKLEVRIDTIGVRVSDRVGESPP